MDTEEYRVEIGRFEDGYDGFDCKTPLCRHRQLDNSVVGCLNGIICTDKDTCHCIQTDSILWIKHAHVDRGITGRTGEDCFNPICKQGYYDPSCRRMPSMCERWTLCISRCM
jgi:hypothetical protein